MQVNIIRSAPAHSLYWFSANQVLGVSLLVPISFLSGCACCAYVDWVKEGSTTREYHEGGYNFSTQSFYGSHYSPSDQTNRMAAGIVVLPVALAWDIATFPIQVLAGYPPYSRKKEAPGEPPVVGGRPVADQPAADRAGGGDAQLLKSFQYFVKQLSDPDADTRWRAVQELAQSADARVIAHLIPVLADSDAMVRFCCAESLGELMASAAVPALIERLDDPELTVRYTAQRSLKKITGASIDFDADGPPDKRADSVRSWREWAKANAGN